MKKLGKNLLWSLLSVLALCFTACSSDDDNNGAANGNTPSDTSKEVKVVDEKETPFVQVLNEDFGSSMLSQLVGGNAGENEDDLQMLAGMRSAAEQHALETLASVGGGNDDAGISDLVNFLVGGITIHYWSVDGDGNPILLSGNIYLPKAWGRYLDCRDIMLSCHPTAFNDLMISMFSMRSHVSDQVVVLEPDYIGFGGTKDMSQTYLCQKLIARQCVDMIPAALEVLEEKGVSMAKGYGTYVVGYSQGGGNAMAVGRHLEMEASDDMKKLVNLKKVTCGAGPYDPMATFNYWLEHDRLSLTVVLPMVIKGMMEGHRDIMEGISLQSYFSNLYKSTGVVDRVDNHELGLDFLMLDNSEELASINLGPCEGSKMFNWMQFSPIMSDEVKNPNSHIRKALEESMSQEVLTDWVPAVPVEIFASTLDNVIPVQANAQAAYDKMVGAGAKNVKINLGDYGDHIAAQMKFNEYLTNLGYRE
jgi:hypothetical protein